METYSDGWDEYRAAVALTKKKLLKAPNSREALASFRRLSVQAVDQDAPELAALCLMQAAGLHEEAGDLLAAQEHWVRAALSFLEAARLRKKCQMSTESQFARQMEMCYLRAAAVSTAARCRHRTAFFLLELALRLMELDMYTLALDYLIKGKTDLVLVSV